MTVQLKAFISLIFLLACKYLLQEHHLMLQPVDRGIIHRIDLSSAFPLHYLFYLVAKQKRFHGFIDVCNRGDETGK